MEFYNETFPVAKKEHTCEMCGEVIHIGEQYSREVGKYEGELFTRKLHQKCKSILTDFIDDTGADEFDYDEIKQWWHDTYCYKCKSYYHTCESVMADGYCETSSVNCPERTADGRCKADETCDEMTRMCWCENYEPIKEN